MQVSSNVSPINASPINESSAAIKEGSLNKSNGRSISNNIIQIRNGVCEFTSIKQFINTKNNNFIDISNIDKIIIKNREYTIQDKDGKVEIIKSKNYRKFDCIKHFLEKCKANHFTSVKKDIKSTVDQKSMVDRKNQIKIITTPVPYGQSAVTSIKASTIPPQPLRPAPSLPARTLTQTAPAKPLSTAIPNPPPMPEHLLYETKKDTVYKPNKDTVSSAPVVSQKQTAHNALIEELQKNKLFRLVE